MRAVNSAAHAQRLKRKAMIEIPMAWFNVVDRDNGSTEGFGVWRGYDDEEITVIDYFADANATRLFHGRGDLLSVGSVRYEAGFTFRSASIRLSGISDVVKNALRAYEPHGARVQVWRRTYDPETRRPLGVELWFPGTVSTIEFTRPTPGGESSVEVEVVSMAMMLGVTSPAKKSHEAQLARHAGDTFRRHKATIAQTEVSWGSKTMRQDGSRD